MPYKFLKFFFFLFFSFFLSFSVNAQLDLDKVNPDQPAMELGLLSGFELDMEVQDIMAIVFNAFLGLLGMIFIAMIVYAGYNWMTAGGDEAKVTKSRETIQKAMIGLAIIVSAYIITAWVFKALDSVA